MDRKLSAALTTYVWPGTKNYPTASPEAVVDRFGTDTATNLVPVIKKLEEEIWQSEWLNGESISDAAARVSASFSSAHPELSTGAVAALVNLWAFGISR